MSTPTLPRPAGHGSVPSERSPGGDNDTQARPRAAKGTTPNDRSPGGDNDTQPAEGRATPSKIPPAGAESRPTSPRATSNGRSSGGAQLAGRQTTIDDHASRAASDQTTDRQSVTDAHSGFAVGSEAGQGQAAIRRSITRPTTLLDPALALAADVLDDTERVLIANANRLRQLTRSAEDSDGEVRGLGLDERHPDVARLAAIVDMLDKVTKDATKNLEKHMRRHPLHPWAKSMRGVGDKQIARLLAVIGDPYIRPEIAHDDGTVIPSGPRTVSALWAYCGYHVLPAGGHAAPDSQPSAVAGRAQLPADHTEFDPRRGAVGGIGGDPGQSWSEVQMKCAGVAPKRARGQKANWSTKAKTRAYLIAESCLKQLVKPCAKPDDAKWATHVEDCRCSVYRVVYDRRRQHTATTRPDWTDGHSHNDALRVMSKEILKDLWRAAKAWHETQR